ncbi:unnamed protein product, partial [Symbiodinium pilosum]
AKKAAEAKLTDLRKAEAKRKAKWRANKKIKAAEAKAKAKEREVLRREMEALAKRPILDE